VIGFEDQNSLFKLISAYLKKDVVCWAFGGTAMMFYGYKEATKDIDLIFESVEDRGIFVLALKELGYTKKSLFNIYSEEKSKHANAPVMYSRGDERFDLFVEKIFKTELSPSIKSRFFARHDFAENKNLIIYVISKEDIILLKSTTDRAKDFEDILKICETDRNINWELLTDEAVWQYKNGNEFMLLDIEGVMAKLKKYVIIKKEYFDKLHKEQK